MTIFEIGVILICLSEIGIALVNYLRKKDVCDIGKLFWQLLSALTITVAFYSILTYGRTYVHSDVATSIMLARSQIKHMSLLPKEWCYANGDLWILSQNLVALPCTFLIKNQSIARCVSACLVLLLTVGCMRLYGKLKNCYDLHLTIIPIFCLGLLGSANHILYETSYTIGMLFFALILYLMTLIIRKEHVKKNRLLLMLLLFLLSMAGIRNLAQYTLPCVGAIFFVWFLENREESINVWRRTIIGSLIDICLMMVASVLGIICCNLIYKTHTVNNFNNGSFNFMETLESIPESLKIYFLCFWRNFGYTSSASLFSVTGIHNIISLFLCIMICFVIPILQIRKLLIEEKEAQLLIIFGLIHITIMFVMNVFVGVTTQIGNSRYVLTSIFVCMLISGRYISKYWLSKNNLSVVFIDFVFTVIVVICSLVMIEWSKNWTEQLKVVQQPSEVLKEHGLEYGVATYWNSYNNVIYSDCEVTIAGIEILENQLYAYYWLVDRDWYKEDEERERTFVMLTHEEINSAAENGLFDNLGDPAEVIPIEDTGLNIYVYNYDIMKKVIK